MLKNENHCILIYMICFCLFDLCTHLLLDLVSWNILFNLCIFLFSQILYPKMGLGSDIALLCFFWCFVPVKQNNYCLIWFIIWASYSLSTCKTWTLAYVSLFFWAYVSLCIPALCTVFSMIINICMIYGIIAHVYTHGVPSLHADAQHYVGDTFIYCCTANDIQLMSY